jgi:hypothetical protein
LRSYKLLRLDDLNEEGFLVNLLDYQWVSLANSDSSSLHQSEKYEISTENNLKTEIGKIYSGYNALEKRKEFSDSALLAKSNVENLNNPESPLVVHNIRTSNIQTGDSITFTPLAENSLIDNPFTSEVRSQPIDFRYEQSLVRELDIKVPQGYKLTSYPESRNFEMQGNFLRCSFNASVEQGTLKLKMSVDIINSFIPPQFYQELKELLENIKKLEQENITFKKDQ